MSQQDFDTLWCIDDDGELHYVFASCLEEVQVYRTKHYPGAYICQVKIEAKLQKTNDALFNERSINEHSINDVVS